MLLRAGLRELLARLVRFRIGLGWYVVALLLFPAIVVGAGMIALWQGAELPPSEAFAYPVAIPVSFFWIFFSAGRYKKKLAGAGWQQTGCQNG